MGEEGTRREGSRNTAGRAVGRVRRVELVRLRAEIKDAKSGNAQLLMQVQFANHADDRIMPMFL
jgi:hypothetical protein